jgi:hypothetical protein
MWAKIVSLKKEYNIKRAMFYAASTLCLEFKLGAGLREEVKYLKNIGLLIT